MESRLYVDMLPQPDNTTCGPTCLHALYRYYADPIPLKAVLSEITYLEEGGTLSVYLALHALLRGYRATIYTYNLDLFDPTWFPAVHSDISRKLRLQAAYKKKKPLMDVATAAYLEYLERGGRLRFEVLTAALIRKYLNRGVPIITGLNATYLYNCAREYGEGNRIHYDDIRGESMGHFVVLSGYDRTRASVFIGDPLRPNPLSRNQQYSVPIYRLLCSIMLGILTYDANLLIIEPQKRRSKKG